MSQQQAPQFTPEQVLAAGRHAESEGRIDYAIQFYRHLTEYYRNTPEATAAGEALARLSHLIEQRPAMPNFTQPSTPRPPPPPRVPERQRAYDSPPAERTALPERSEPAFSWPDPARPQAADHAGNDPDDQQTARLAERLSGSQTSMPSGGADPYAGRNAYHQSATEQNPYGHSTPDQGAPAPPPLGAPAPSPAASTPYVSQTPDAPEAEAPDPVKGYRLGRFLAALVSLIGALICIVVVIGVTSFVLGVRPVAALISGQTLGAVAGTLGAVFAAGVFMILFGQICLAIFATANSTRTLVLWAEFEAGYEED